MRISDWSSDVCSSDLSEAGSRRESAQSCRSQSETRDRRKSTPRSRSSGSRTGANRGGRASSAGSRRAGRARPTRMAGEGRTGEGGTNAARGRRRKPARGGEGSEAALDRKRVVQGKSVSVRVDLGGGGSSKKTRTHKRRNE